VPGVEDLLNVAIWEDGGNKQWCKFDVPDPSEFEALLRWQPGNHNCTMSCTDIASDPRYHPAGVPKVFFSAGHAVQPEESAQLIERLAQRQAAETLPPPIMFKGSFYADGAKLRKAHPEVRCVT